MAGSGLEVKMAVPEGQRYSCRQCGWCCRWWKIEVTPQERDRLEAHDWATENPRLAGVDLFWEHRSPGNPLPTIQTAQIRRQCVFLDPDGLCIIHKVLGEDAKPATCRRFPIVAGFVGWEPLVTLDCSCSAVIRNEGEPAEVMEQDASYWLADAARSVHSASDPTPILEDGVAINWRSYLSLENDLLEIAADGSRPMSQRLLSGYRLIGGEEGLASIMPPLGLIAPMIADVETPHSPTTGRGSNSIGYALAVTDQRSALYLSTLGVSVDLEAARGVVCDLDSAQFDDILTRFVCGYIMGKSLLKSATIKDGWSYLATCLALAGWYAQASAATHGRQAANLDDVVTGIEVIGKAFVP